MTYIIDDIHNEHAPRVVYAQDTLVRHESHEK